MWDAIYAECSVSAQAAEKIIALGDKMVDFNRSMKMYTVANTPKARERVIAAAQRKFAEGNVEKGQELYALAEQTPSPCLLALWAQKLLEQANIIAALRVYEFSGQQPPADTLATATEKCVQRRDYWSAYIGCVALNTVEARTKMFSLAEMLSADESQMYTAACMYAGAGTEEAIAKIMPLGDKLAAAADVQFSRVELFREALYAYKLAMKLEKDGTRAAVAREKLLGCAIKLALRYDGGNAIATIRELGIDAELAKRLIETADDPTLSGRIKKRIYLAVGNVEACTKVLAIGDMELAMPYHPRPGEYCARLEEAFETYSLVLNCDSCGQPRDHGVTHDE